MQDYYFDSETLLIFELFSCKNRMIFVISHFNCNDTIVNHSHFAVWNIDNGDNFEILNLNVLW
jgi:hypothetical protein